VTGYARENGITSVANHQAAESGLRQQDAAKNASSDTMKRSSRSCFPFREDMRQELCKWFTGTSKALMNI